MLVRRKPASPCHRWGNWSSVKLSDLPFDLANNGLLTWTNWDRGSWLTSISSINILLYSLPVTQSLGTQNLPLMKSLGRRRQERAQGKEIFQRLKCKNPWSLCVMVVESYQQQSTRKPAWGAWGPPLQLLWSASKNILNLTALIYA